MTTYFKATRLDGLSFQMPHVDYGAALVSGEVVRHPAKKKVRNEPSTYLSVSIAAADCTGFSWPCRLFRVEPVGRVMANLEASPNKRAVSALRVVEELPAHLALGNGEQVAAFIEACRTPTKEDWLRVAAAWDAARDAAWAAAWAAAGDAAWAAAWDAARDAARAAARAAARDAAGAAAWAAAWDAAGAAAWAMVARDLITPAQYDTLTQPFVDAGFAGMVGR